MSDGRRPVILGAGEGREYEMGGRIAATFKAGGAETARGYSISEWWLEPHTRGPGPHSHPKDDVFYGLAGAMSVLVGERWIEVTRGALVLIPGGVTHDFENRGDVRAGMLNLAAPGDFEEQMPAIAEWFRARSPQDAWA
jgi:mannose-6-phosphate isomerase-like protein (cupin superfamily)